MTAPTPAKTVLMLEWWVTCPACGYRWRMAMGPAPEGTPFVSVYLECPYCGYRPEFTKEVTS